MNNENFKRIFNENSKTFSLASKFFDENYLLIFQNFIMYVDVLMILLIM